MKTIELEHLFFGALKLLLSANPNSSLTAIPESVLSWGSALLAPFTVEPCIASKNKCSNSTSTTFLSLVVYVFCNMDVIIL
ncbi:MAG: hypothetical protein ABSB95_14090 [Dissulfurispiraceae bacterium]|jgi:hypothetical protein